MAAKIRKGDRVQVLTGKDRGRQSTVARVIPREGKVIVDGVNVARKHTRANPQKNTPGGIIEVDMPLDASNVAVLSPKDGKPTRVGYRIDADGTKVRICRRTGVEL
ncbi:MAG: 50S ribosomal protein L24 [Acidimicrobiales bacterium]